MSLNKVLSVITQGKVDFCCLCSQQTVSSQNKINAKVFIDSQDIQTMSGLLDLILGEDIKTAASAFGVFCDKCKVSLVNSYKFRKMCRNNLNKFVSAVDLVTEAFENVLPDLDSYKTLFVSLDLKNFTSEQFYDETKFENPTSAIRIISSVLNPPVKEEGKEDEEEEKYEEQNIPTCFPENRNNLTNITCKICQTDFKTEKKLQSHYFKKHHSEHQLVKCRKCPLEFVSKEITRQHEEDIHSLGVCSKCGKSFTNKQVLKKHIMNHNLQMSCYECGRVYRSASGFKRHIDDDICRQTSKKPAGQGMFQCDHCKKRYNYKRYLALHIIHEHGNAEGFRCGFCNKQCYTLSALNSHLLTHTGEKKFGCEICNGKFVSKQSLINHTRLHTGDKPYQCDYCERTFASKSRRLDHTRSAHLEPSFECNICHTKFKQSYNLLKHKRRHLNPNSRLHTVQQSYTPNNNKQDVNSSLSLG